MDISVKGAEQLKSLAKDLRAADKDIKREAMRELRAAGKPAGEAIRTAYGAELPHRGGLADRIRRSTISVQIRAAGVSIGAQVKLRNKHDLRSIEAGRLRHPTFGRGEWVDQKVPAEIGGKAFEREAPMVQRHMLAALDRVAAKITRG